MSSISVSRWWRKPNRPRYYISDGRTPLGTVFESKGVFAAVDSTGRLVVGSTTLKIAVDALCPAMGAST
jgi:hypothetical protein